MTSTTDAAGRPGSGVPAGALAPAGARTRLDEAAARMRLGPRTAGWGFAIAGMALLWVPQLIAAAIGLELLAAAFWWWARASDDVADQVARWQWLRRPATALWLAFAIHAAFALPSGEHAAALAARGALHAFVRGNEWLPAFSFLEAAAVVWGALELLAALPLTRAYSDFPGPFIAARPWLPALLPAAGFLVLWRQDAHWIDVADVRRAAIVLLLVTALLGVLRAYARRSWVACLRWMVVTDGALAALVVAGGAIARTPAVLLWVAASSAHALLLAGELRGAAPRRGHMLTRLWRAACWVSIACLAWPAVVTNADDRLGPLSRVVAPGIALTAAMLTWLSVGRLVHAEERRRVMRADPVLTLNHIAPITVLVLAPLALVLAWWAGFEPNWKPSVMALLPVGLAGWAAILARQRQVRALWQSLEERVGGVSRVAARRAFDGFVRLERRVIALLARLGGALMGPVHDLHTGDAQEYLLFLVGIAVLAVVLPLLR